MFNKVELKSNIFSELRKTPGLTRGDIEVIEKLLHVMPGACPELDSGRPGIFLLKKRTIIPG